MAEIQVSVTGYATMQHVESYLPQRTFNSSSSPTRDGVLQFITDIYHQMNGVLDVLGYNLPIPSGNSTAIAILRNINGLGAASQAEQAANQIGNVRASRVGDILRKEYDREFMLLMDGDKVLPGVNRNTQFWHEKKQKAPEFAFDLDDKGNEDDPVFRKDTLF